MPVADGYAINVVNFSLDLGEVLTSVAENIPLKATSERSNIDAPKSV
jgi:hypothetical protein